MLSLTDCDDIIRHYDRVSSTLGLGWSIVPVDSASCFVTRVTLNDDVDGVQIAFTVRIRYNSIADDWSFDERNLDQPKASMGTFKGNLALEDLISTLRGFCRKENVANVADGRKRRHEDAADDADAPIQRCSSNGADTKSHAKENSNPLENLTNFAVDLTNSDIRRYSRQLILPEIGVAGQVALRDGSVLIVGAGGLGCPAGVFLAAAGVGRLGIVDYDVVEISNLHRQIAHSEDKVDVSKAESLAQACRCLNSSCAAVAIPTQISSANALELMAGYDIVLDCTDNVASRYLLNDACIILGKTLVSGSALRWEGQLTVYNYASGPCYRCIFPNPPPPETVTNCSDGGVIGVVPGIVGSLQALEAIKILCDAGAVCSQRLLLFDGLECSFRKIKLRNRKDDCRVCGRDPDIKHLIDYELFCGAAASDKDFSLSLLRSADRISVVDYRSLLVRDEPHLLVDVRTSVETDLCRLPTAPGTEWWNVPIEELKRKTSDESTRDALKRELVEKLAKGPKTSVVAVCRRGNDSQVAVSLLKSLFEGSNDGLRSDNLNASVIRDITGGLHAWAKRIDANFPVY